MTNQEFIDKINNYRINAQGLIEGNGGYNLQRGMGHTISGYVEDLFGLFIAKKIDRNDLQFLVDKVTSTHFEGKSRAKSFKPDLSIIENNVLTHYFDLKTNMGWNREFEGYLNDKNEFIEKIRGANAWIRHSNDNVQGISISNKIVYQMVIIYGWNINFDLLVNNIELAKKYKNVNVNVLYHKNVATNQFEINEEGFNSIFKTLPK